jgi:hypothetical protein
MARNTVGTLSLFINGDAAGLMREFNKVDRQLTRWSGKWTKDGARLAMGFIGVSSAVTAVAGQVRNVISNIESIPGVPAETVASIITLRDNLAGAKNWIDQMTAGIVAFGVKAAQAVGVAVAELAGHTDLSTLGRQETPDEIAAAKDAGYHDKIVAATQRLAAAQRAASEAGRSEVEQIVALRREAESLEAFARSNSINTVQRLEAQTTAAEKLGAAEKQMAALRKQLLDVEEASGNAFGAVLLARSPRPPALNIADLDRGAAEVRRRLTDLQMGDQADPANLQKQIELRRQLVTIYDRLEGQLERQAELAKDIGSSFASSFESAVIGGEKLQDVLGNLARDVIGLIFRQQVTTPLASGVGSALRKMLGFADGGRPPVGKASIVGERGPEVFIPDTAGRIVPNHQLSSPGGSQGGLVVNQVFQIESGVTRQELTGLMPRILEASKAAVHDAVMRGGGYARGFR